MFLANDCWYFIILCVNVYFSLGKYSNYFLKRKKCSNKLNLKLIPNCANLMTFCFSAWTPIFIYSFTFGLGNIANKDTVNFLCKKENEIFYFTTNVFQKGTCLIFL